VSGGRNTLYVTSAGAYVAKDHETAQVRVTGEVKVTVPLHHLSSIVCFGPITVSPALMADCSERGIEVAFLTEHGRFLARVDGVAQSGATLRRAQYRAADDPVRSLELAKAFVVGKVANARTTLQRSAREQQDAVAVERLERAVAAMEHRLPGALASKTADELRGQEGEAAATYFGAFDHMIRQQREAFRFEGRSRRPPGDAMNALLSFLYGLLLNDAAGALAAVGLDPAIGYLHVDRPGRPSLALDLCEEFRPFLADRTALAMVNLQQVRGEGFIKRETGGVEMSDNTRKAVITAYQERKQESIRHPFTEEETSVGLLIHQQARLLARAIRGDLDAYPPFHAR
jgi:CRISP-associated protein Cas1